MNSLFILYVADQDRSRDFYARGLVAEPALGGPGMTEFALSADTGPGLMPEQGIKRRLGDPVPDEPAEQESSGNSPGEEPDGAA